MGRKRAGGPPVGGDVDLLQPGSVGHLEPVVGRNDQRACGERVRGRGFERLCRWVLENAPEYAAKVEKVWLWDDWPGRWAADAGIDLVARDRDGGLWAVQAKHYAPAYAIRKADVDSFLSESSRPEFTYRLLKALAESGASAS